MAAFYRKAHQLAGAVTLAALSGGSRCAPRVPCFPYPRVLSWNTRRRDVQVPRWLNGAGTELGVFASVEDLPLIQVSTDHQCIVWCNQVVVHTATTLLELASGAAADRSLPVAHYTSVLRRRYPAGTETAAPRSIPSRRDIAVWAVVSLPKLPAFSAASVAAFASEVRIHRRMARVCARTLSFACVGRARVKSGTVHGDRRARSVDVCSSAQDACACGCAFLAVVAFSER